MHREKERGRGDVICLMHGHCRMATTAENGRKGDTGNFHSDGRGLLNRGVTLCNIVMF